MNWVVTQRFGIQTGPHVFHLYIYIYFFYRFDDRGAHLLLTVDIIWEHPLSVGPYIFLCEANEE